MFEEIKSATSFGRANAQIINGDYRSAVKSLEIAKELTERDEMKIVYDLKIGECYLKLEQFKESMAILSRVRKEMSEDPETWSQGIGLELNQQADINIQICGHKMTHNKTRNEMDGSVEPPIR